jgi:hypothetical protein
MNHYIFNPDFIDFIDALNTSSVKYLLVGGYAVILNGYIRTTGDMDIWVLPTKENYQQLSEAFYRFGMPTFDMTLQKFLLTEQYDVFTFGRPPISIDILTKVKGISFVEAYENAEWFAIDEKISVRFIGLSDLITAKQSAGRPKDLDDLENLLN